MQSVPAERLRRFFAKLDGHYQISKAIREMCVFAQHDVTTGFQLHLSKPVPPAELVSQVARLAGRAGGD